MRVRLAIIGIALVLIAGTSYLLVTKNSTDLAEHAKVASITLDPQNDETKVLVQSATLIEDGYVVARAVESTRLGQVVEISELLPAGSHENITISLGDFYTGGQELIVLIYADNGDGVFNDLDKPYADAAGNITAKYVQTGAVVSQGILKANSTVAGHVMGNTPMVQVRYTDTGFVPAQINVAVGTMVEFVNESSKPMWVASNEHPEHSILPTFDEFESVPTGATYTYVFDKKGSWAYHDHINPAVEGVVNVN